MQDSGIRLRIKQALASAPFGENTVSALHRAMGEVGWHRDRSALSRLISGEREIKASDIKALADALKVDAHWLQFGNEVRDLRRVSLAEEYLEDQIPPEEQYSAFSREHYAPKIPGSIPELDLQAGAGEGKVGQTLALEIGNEAYSGHRVVSEWLLPEAYLRERLGINPKFAIVAEVIGDSMTPTFMPNEKVIIDLRQDVYQWDDSVYLISDGFNAPQIKRLLAVFGSRPPAVEIYSDNPSVQPKRTVLLSDIKILGRVAGRLLRM